MSEETKDAIWRLNDIKRAYPLDKSDEWAVDMAIAALSVEPRTGHWIFTENHTWCCSECGGNPHRGTGFVPNKDGMKMRWKYCNLCGAKMEG